MVSYQAAVLIAALALRGLPHALGQEIRVLTYRSSLDDTDQPYAVYLPKGYSPLQKYPLLVSLHGAGGDHRSGLRQVLGSLEKPRELPLIAVAPYGRGSMGYTGIADRDVLDAMRAVEEAFSLDPARYYLTGVSMGGSGSYHLLTQYPGLWAAGVIVCGMPTPEIKASRDRLHGTALWLFHGEADEVVPVAESRDAFQALRARNASVRYTEYPKAGHNIAPLVYAGGDWLRWMMEFQRTPTPIPEHKPGLGIKAILSYRATYVYGPGRADVAREASNWAGLRGRPAFHVVVSSADDALPAGPLFFFGHFEQGIASRLPMRVKPEFAGGYGLLSLSRVEGRLVALSSGLPWWSGKSIALDRGFRWQWLSLPYRLLDALPDWVLFEGSLDRVIAQGHWNARGELSAEDRRTLTLTGKVDLRP